MKGGDALVPVVPENLVKDWFNHPRFGKELGKMMDGLIEEFGPIPEDTPPEAPVKDDNDPTTPASKRRKLNTTPTPGSSGKGKLSHIDPEKFLEISAVGEDKLLRSIPISNAKGPGLTVHVKLENKPYVFNKSLRA